MTRDHRDTIHTDVDTTNRAENRRPDRRKLGAVLPGRCPLVGMVHLLPLPDSPGWAGSMRTIVERARADAIALQDAGCDGVLIENFGDVPFLPDSVPPVTVAAMTTAALAVADATTLPFGINVLRNDARSAIAIAAATGAAFIRSNVHTGAMLTDQGWLEGRAHETLRARAALAPGVAILADVFVKHAAPPSSLSIADAARDTWERGLADALIVTGTATGSPADLGRVRAVRDATPEAAVWIGSGVDEQRAAEAVAVADGVIIGSALQRAGKAGSGVDPARARAVVAALRRALQA